MNDHTRVLTNMSQNAIRKVRSGSREDAAKNIEELIDMIDSDDEELSNICMKEVVKQIIRDLGE